MISSGCVFKNKTIPHDDLAFSSPIMHFKSACLCVCQCNVQAWALLQGWYGGGPALLRRGIVESRGSRNAIVELHGIQIKVLLSTDKTNVKDMNVSKASTVRELKESIMAEFNIKVRLCFFL
jgi:hypothetical protein